MDLLVVSLAALVLAVGSIAALEASEIRRRGPRHTVELRFGRDVTPEAVTGILEQISARRSGGPVIVDLLADHRGVRHLLSAERATLDQLRASLRAFIPSARLVPTQPSSGEWAIGRQVTLRGRLKILRDDEPQAASAALLAAVQPVAAGERVRLRWVIWAGRAEQVPRVEHGVAVEPEDRRRLRVKNAGGVVRARATIAVAAATPGRAQQLAARLATVLRARTTAYGGFSFLPLLRWQLGRLDRMTHHLPRGERYAVSELSGLLGWPIGAPALPGVSLGTSPLLIPSAKLPRSGRVLGTATWPGDERPIAQPLLGSMSHSLIVGPTGVGKSTLLLNLIDADLRAGRGMVLIDGKGDTARAALSLIPKARLDDVIVLDCASDGPLPGLKLFSGRDASLAADVVLGVLADLFKDSWGPLSERWLRAGLLAVAQDPDGTLADVPYVFSNAAYRRRLVGQVRDPLLKSLFAGFEAMSASERQHQLAAPLGKLNQLLGRPVVRTVLGQPEPKLDFNAVLDQQKIVIVSLAPLRVGASAARLIGALTVYGLFQAVLSRSELAPANRKPFSIFIDEPKSLGDLPMPVDTLLEQARGLSVGLTLAPQSLGQLPKSVREAVLTNVATRVVFRQDADDARLLARGLPGVTAEELQELAAYEAVARVGLGPGDIAPPVSIRTAPSPKSLRDFRQLRAASERRYGMTLEDVDTRLRTRHEESGDGGPVGRRRRAS